MRRERFFVFRGKGLGGVWAGPDCGILGLSSRWFVGFLGVCVGLSGLFFLFFVFFLGMQGFFSHFVDFFLLVWGPRGSEPWG